MSDVVDTSSTDANGVRNVSLKIPFPETFIYANCCAFAIGQMEIRLGFGEAMQDSTVMSKAGIILPPEAAAVIALVLFQQVRIFEENFGEIRHPSWKAMKEAAKEGRDFILPPLAAG
jgi:hypothetical protein